MASQKVFIIAAPRQGAGLFHELICLDNSFQSSELSRTSLTDLAFSELELESVASHNLLDIDLTDDEQNRLITHLQALVSSVSGACVDYHPSFAINVPLLRKAFPEAKFIFVGRDFARSIASGIIAWQSGKFVTESELPTWWGTKWSFPLIPGWIELVGEPINEIVARQFSEIALAALSALEDIPKDSIAVVGFENLLSNPSKIIGETLSTLGVNWVAEIPQKLPRSKGSTKGNADLEATGIMELARTGVLAHAARFKELSQKLSVLGLNLDLPSSSSQQIAKGGSGEKPTGVVKRKSEGTPFVAHFSGALPELLTKAKASLIFSAYNSGLVGTVRADGNAIDTSYIKIPKPMGMAISEGKLAISTLDSIRGYQQQNQLSGKFTPPLSPDVVYVPQSTVHTGHLAIHDMAYGTAPGYEGLWFINSAFSCLSLMHPNYSFVPKWRPKWITGLAFENRCHLNGLAMVDGAPRYVTSLSQADTPQGWREDKGTSGVIVDITTNRVVTSGLSMPHSPRWHKNKLFFLESGKGSLATVDHRSGEVTTIATLPGFTRGLAFIGDYALVGLSQVRESAFKDLPVTSNKDERNCGIWVVDVRNGKTVSTLKFDGVIQELFEITVVENSKWPMFIDRIPEAGTAFVLPKAALREVRASKQRSS